MIKAFLTLLALYFIYRIVRAFMKAKVMIKTFNYHNHNHYNNKTSQEGEVIIEDKTAKSSKGQISPDAGDYVDYEEIKE